MYAPADHGTPVELVRIPGDSSSVGVAAVFNGIIADLLQCPALGELRRRTAQFKIIEHELLPVVEQARCGRLT